MKRLILFSRLFSHKMLLIACTCALMLSSTACEELTLDDIINIGQEALTNEEVIEGLKSALTVGTDSSVTRANITNGYFANEAIKILLPNELDVVQNIIDNELSFLPFVQVEAQELINDLVLRLNRAAENAADKAKPIFINAITDISIEDGFAILNGNDNAATTYLKDNTVNNLYTAFKPDIQDALEAVQAQQIWNELFSLINSVPLVNTDVNPDLADYTTSKALDGLFHLVGEEERDIRVDINARVNDILQRVFGSLDQ